MSSRKGDFFMDMLGMPIEGEIKCEKDICIYNTGNNMCQFSSIEVNGYGMCDVCVIVDIDDDTLRALKKGTRFNL